MLNKNFFSILKKMHLDFQIHIETSLNYKMGSEFFTISISNRIVSFFVDPLKRYGADNFLNIIRLRIFLVFFGQNISVILTNKTL